MGHMGQKGQRVILTEDLTKYGDGLLPGLVGTIGEDHGSWSRAYDRFVWVHFDNGRSLDVLRRNLTFGEGLPKSVEVVTPPLPTPDQLRLRVTRAKALLAEEEHRRDSGQSYVNYIIEEMPQYIAKYEAALAEAEQ